MAEAKRHRSRGATGSTLKKGVCKVEIREIEENITKVFGEFENFIFVGYSKGAESTLTVGDIKDSQSFTNHLVELCMQRPEIRYHLEQFSGFLRMVLDTYYEWVEPKKGTVIH